MRHHHEMRPPAPHELRHVAGDLRSQESQRLDLRHPEMQRHQELSRQDISRHQDIRQQDIQAIRSDISAIGHARSNHEYLELKIDTDLRIRNNQPQQQQPPQNQGHQQRNLKRTMSDSDCDDVFSEESGKEPYVYLYILVIQFFIQLKLYTNITIKSKQINISNFHKNIYNLLKSGQKNLVI
jgi:hypothetical protein